MDMDTVDALGEPTESDVVDARGQPGGGSRVGAAAQKESDFVADMYNMKHKNRGIAVIFNNKVFHRRLQMGDRQGTDVDCENMYNLLSTMGFDDIRTFHDSTVKEMRQEMQQVSKEDHTQNDCLVCVILSHGEEGYVFGQDDKVPIDELVLPFKGNNCPSLGGKPKLFFIQACRGTDLDSGVEVSDAAPDEEESMEEEVVMRRIPTEADFLMAYSVVPGYFAWRNSSRGSWFVQAIYDVFSEHWEKMDVLSMMTRVNKKVAYDFQSNASKEFMNRKKQIPCITSMLTKDVYFKG